MDRYRLTDSPWFWGLTFSVMALVGIGLIAPKFDKRQRQVEGRFLGRQQSAIERERRAAGLRGTVWRAESAARVVGVVPPYRPPRGRREGERRREAGIG